MFASPHAKGRERVCSVLLAHDANWSAAAIIKQLPTLPTDRERASGWTPEREAKASAVWAKARVNAFPKQAAADQTASGDAWDRAIAANTGESGSTAASDAWARARAQVYPEQAAKGDLWERAYASNNQAH